MAAQVISPAVRRALGFTLVAWKLPTHLHLSTWSAAYALTETDMNGHRSPVPAALEAAKGDPFAQAVAYMHAQGFAFEYGADGPRIHPKGHYASFVHGDGRTGSAYRSGVCMIRPAIAPGAQPPFPLATEVARFKPGHRTVTA